MNPTQILKTFALLLATASISYAVDLQQYDERERRMARPPQSAAKPQSQQIPEYVKIRQEQQRQENIPRQEISPFRNPRSVNIDRLKVQSDTPAEYQFEQIQALSIQEGDPSRTEEAIKEESTATALEEQLSDEQPGEEVAAVEPTPEAAAEEVAPKGQVITAGGGSRLQIIEENNRIIVLQVDTVPAAGSQAR